MVCEPCFEVQAGVMERSRIIKGTCQLTYPEVKVKTCRSKRIQTFYIAKVPNIINIAMAVISNLCDSFAAACEGFHLALCNSRYELLKKFRK